MSKLQDLAVIMFVVGTVPTVESLYKFISLAWTIISQPVVLFREEGYFVV